MTRGEVIEGLEFCAANPNKNDNGWSTQVSMNLVLDAIDLLKEQQPRVLDISEFEPFEPMMVWLEDVDKEYVVPAMYFFAPHGRLGFKLAKNTPADKIYPMKRDYNKRWRAWTKKPNNEQRRAKQWWQ